MSLRVRRWRGTRPFGRVLLIAFFAVLTLSIATWIRSYWVSDAWSYREARTVDDGRVHVLLLEVWSGRGSLVFARHAWQFDSHGDRSGRRFRWMRHPASSAAEGLAPFKPATLRAGFAYVRDTASATPVAALVVPCWAIVLLLSLPTLWLTWRAYVRVRRRTLGLCARCGYDLRASKDACPECGAAVPAPSLPVGHDAATPR